MTSSSPTNKVYWQLLIPLAIIKMAVHIFTNTLTKYGLHRDEYLYISDSDHLAWGYMEMPPMLAVIGKIARLLFGDTLFAVRFFNLRQICALFGRSWQRKRKGRRGIDHFISPSFLKYYQYEFTTYF